MTSLFGAPTLQQSADVRSREYQELKGRVHNELLGRLNLERLSKVRREDAEPEIKGLILGLLERESQTTPLSLFERDALITDVLHEIFGLGPLEALLKDGTISDILVNRYNQVYVEREGRLEETDIVFPERCAPLPNHRAHRQPRGSPHRRVEPDGRCASAGWFARQRRHSAASARRPGPLDSPIPHRPHRGARSGRAHESHAADARLPQGRCRGADEHHRVGRHGRRQDDAAQRALELHLRARTDRDDRRRRRVDPASAAHRAARDPPARTSRARAPCGSGSSLSTPSVCVQTASSSARSAARKRWTCCRR